MVVTIGFIPIVEVPYTLNVQYQDTETYYELEPCEIVETYYENEPYEVVEVYNDVVPLNYETNAYITEDTIQEHNSVIIGGVAFQDEIVDVPVQVANVDIKNTDDIPGSFTISFSGINSIFGSVLLTQTLDILPGETKTAKCVTESIGIWDYDIIPGTKSVIGERIVTKYRQIERERTTTMTIQVLKERPVTKERTEIHYKRIPIFAYLISNF